jgi:hypothetical protein
MENNKYFTPDIEDLCIGYELEVNYNFKLNDIFNKKIIDSFEQLADIHSRMVGDCVIKVLYLTKEQIEAEGWTSFVTEYEGDIVPEKMTYTFFREDRNYMLGWWFNTNKITLIIKDPSLVSDYYTEPTFRGECKDINTFRKIIKLLGI